MNLINQNISSSNQKVFNLEEKNKFFENKIEELLERNSYLAENLEKAK